MSRAQRVLFVCIENACRSRMAAGFARMPDASRVEAHSAGSHHANVVNPRAIAFMSERCCDISAQIPKRMSAFADQMFDPEVTMGRGDARPWLPVRRREDWALPDPESRSAEDLRAVRGEIAQRVMALLGRAEANP